jgi:hypothetical protein
VIVNTGSAVNMVSSTLLCCISSALPLASVIKCMLFEVLLLGHEPSAIGRTQWQLFSTQ